MRIARRAAVLALVLAASACDKNNPIAPEAESVHASSPTPLLEPDLAPRRGGNLIGSDS